MSLTTTGFDRPRLIDIKADLDQRFIDALGPVNTAPDAVVGQIIGILAAALDDAWEALQNTYDAMYPYSAEGVSLDGAVAFVGMERIAAAVTTVVAMCYGTESTLIPAGAIARSLDNRQYVTTTDTVIAQSAAGDVEIEVLTVTNSANYQIIAGGVSVIYTSDASATAEEIVAGLAALFDPLNFTATATGAMLRIHSADSYSGFVITLDSKLGITLLGTPVTFTALDLGAFALPANSLTQIDSMLTGWDSINNLVDGNIGRAVETDEELRLRHRDAIRVTGAATVQAIRSRLLADVPSVEYVAVYENRTNVIDAFNLPPHSFETVVSGGLDQAVGEKIFEVKPAGIETYGNTSVSVIDENNDAQQMNFSREVEKIAWIRVSVNSLYTEEILTTEAIQAIKDAVLAHGLTLNIGEDLILQRFYGPIYDATEGIGSITVEGALTVLITDTPVYSTLNQTVGRTEHAHFDLARITVVGI